MAGHTHDDSPSAWGSYQMRTHLNREHGLSIPMAWDVGRLHEEHLHAHVRGNLAQLDKECQAFYGVGDGTSATCRRPVNHPEIGEDGIGHSPQPIPITPKAEEAPMTHEHTAAEHQGGPALSQHLGRAHGYSSSNDLENFTVTHRRLHAEEDAAAKETEEKGLYEGTELEATARQIYENTDQDLGARPDWDDLGQEARDEYRDRARINRAATDEAEFAGRVAAVRARRAAEDPLETQARHLWMANYDRRNPDGWDELAEETKGYWRRQAQIKADKDRQAEIGYGAAGAERIEREASWQINRDRIIAAMAGIDFDTAWAPDNGIGPNGRGALRSVYKEPADRLMHWLERGGAMVLPAYASLGEDLEKERALVVDMESTNNQLREQLATTGRQLQTALSQKDALFEEMGTLRQKYDDQLAEVTDERDGAQQALMRKLAETGALRDQLAIDQREHGASLDAVQRALEAVTAERDALGSRVHTQARLLETRTSALDEGRAALRALVAELRESGWESSSVYQRLVKILLPIGQAVTVYIGDTEVKPSALSPFDSNGHDPHEDAEPGTDPLAEAHQDLLGWARRFSAGEI